jgi:hypothetical protein
MSVSDPTATYVVCVRPQLDGTGVLHSRAVGEDTSLSGSGSFKVLAMKGAFAGAALLDYVSPTVVLH